MPKNPLKFGRRKSSALLFEDAATPTPGVSSFRVLERPEKINLNGDEGPATALRPVPRPFDSPIAHLRAASSDRLDVSPSRSVHSSVGAHDWTLKGGRGSGGTVRSGSSGVYGSTATSARHSSTSTLPSSIDAEQEQDNEELFPRKTRAASAFHDIPLNDNEPLVHPTPFSDRAAQAIAFAQKHGRTHSTPHFDPTPPARPQNAARSPERHSSPRRERAMTTSSYASTAKPDAYTGMPSPDLSKVYSSPMNRPNSSDAWDSPLPPLPSAAAYSRTDSPPVFHTRTASQSPYRHTPEIARDDNNSPDAWDRRGSADRLMPGSPSHSPDLSPPPPPPHGSSTFFGQSNEGYAHVPNLNSSPVLERWSSSEQDGFLPDTYLRYNAQFEPVKPPSPRKEIGAETVGDDESRSAASSRNLTPRAFRVASGRFGNDAPIDLSPYASPARMVRPPTQRSASSTPKRMTKEQFERLQRRRDSNTEESEEDDLRSDGDESEMEDDSEHAKRMAKMRSRQEANMSLYRQQMRKVTGGATTGASSAARPGFDRSPASSPALGSSDSSIHFGGTSGTPPPEAASAQQNDDDEDDDVPLGILQAHGFPHSSRPASRAQERDSAMQRQPSPAGSASGRGNSPGNLPPFARRLPADPYFGAGIVKPSNRESLGLGGTSSVYGGSAAPMPAMGQPGGLVGIIAGEERARASRRGSPNPLTGTYGPIPPQMGTAPARPASLMPSNRSTSMGSMMPPQIYLPSGIGPLPMLGMPPMPLPSDPQQQEQMQQWMHMQMQFMQNMMTMQQAQQQQQPLLNQMASTSREQSPDFLAVPAGQAKRHSTSSAASVAPSATRSGRAMSALIPPNSWNAPLNVQRHSSYAPSGLNIPLSGPASGYAPSIAPTERSNVGMPSRYRPVHVSSDSSLRSTSMAATTNVNDAASDTDKSQPKATIRAIDKPKGTPRTTIKTPSMTSEEDDDGWAEMKKKREEKKSKFRFGRKSRETLTMEELVHELR